MNNLRAYQFIWIWEKNYINYVIIILYFKSNYLSIKYYVA